MSLAPAAVVRAVYRRPGLAAARLITIVMVVAATSAVMAIAAGTVLRPLPFPQPDRLVQIYDLDRDSNAISNAMPMFPVLFNHMSARGPSIEAITGIWQQERAVAGRGEPESISAGRVADQFFSLLGAQFAVGRGFTSEEVADDAAVVVLSHGLWTRMFGADPGVIGSVIHVDRRPYTVVGVTTADFEPLFTSTQLWTPLRIANPAAVRATVVVTIGRLAPTASAASATADLQPVLREARQALPDLLETSTLNALDLHEYRFGPRRNALLLLIAVVAALGLIATANLANLTFVDLSSRMGDIALRSALGGSTGRIVGAELLPCAALAVVGAAIGLASAALIAPWIVSLDPSLTASGITMVIDWRVAAAAVTAALVVMTVAVAVPCWRIARRDQLQFVSATRMTDARGGRIRTWLVAAQTAMAIVLLSASALVIASVQRTANIDPGFTASNVIAGQLRLAESAFPDHAARSRFLRAVLERLQDTPGVLGAGTTLNPFAPGSSFTTNVTIEDAPRPGGQGYTTQFRRVTPGYFEAMRIPIIKGRAFDSRDSETTPTVAVVSDAFARTYWPDGSAIGRRIKRGAATSPWAEIVGIVADVRDSGLTQGTGPVIYTSYYQSSTAATPAGLVVRTAGDPRLFLSQVKQAIWEIDPNQPLANVVVLDDFLSASLGPQRFRAWLVGVCTLFGLVLAIVGIYGVTARAVTERTKEVGIRMVFGGRPAEVWWQLVKSSVTAIVAGAAAGAALSAAVDAGLLRLLPDLGGSDWLFRTAAAGMMLLTGTVAAGLAAVRATTVEPTRALRGN